MKSPFAMEIDSIQSVRLSMKILTISGPLHREYGGPPMAATGVAASLANLGNEVEIIVCGQSATDVRINSTFFDRLNNSGAKIKILSRKRESKYGAALRLNEWVSVGNSIRQSDIVILHQVFELQYLYIFPALILLRRPYVIMPHGTLTTYQRKQHRIRKLMLWPAQFLLLNSAKSIFVATEQEKIQLPRILKTRAQVVGLGIDVGRHIHRNSQNLNQTFTLLFMGRIAKKKRLDIALHAFARASAESKVEMKFIVCGSGETQYLDFLKQLVSDLGIRPNVEFRGWVDLSAKAEAFLESSCFILTSEDENFAIAAAEALSYGIPCILSKNVALSTLVEKYQAGVTFEKLETLEIKNAINQVSKSDILSLKTAAQRAASELSWDAVATKWNQSLQILLEI